MLKWIAGIAIAAAALLLAVGGYEILISGWPMTVDDGPSADVAAVNEIMRGRFGSVAGFGTEIFTVAEGDYAVNASNLGEGWAMRAFQRKNGNWVYLHRLANTDACSLKKAGFPGDAARKIAASFAWRMLDHGDPPSHCWTVGSAV